MAYTAFFNDQQWKVMLKTKSYKFIGTWEQNIYWISLAKQKTTPTNLIIKSSTFKYGKLKK